MTRLISAGTIDRVPVFVHWTLLVGCGVLLLGSLESLRRLAAATAAIAAYFAAMLLHEWGHVVLARRRRCQVFGVQLYPFVGITRFEQPRGRLDHCVIAWGGILFQGAVGIPTLAWILLVGYTSVEVVDAFLGVFAYLTVIMLPFNLAPVAPLDGATAWGIVPLLFRRARANTGRSTPKGWNAPR